MAKDRFKPSGKPHAGGGGKIPDRPKIQNPPSDPVKPRRVGDPTGEPKLSFSAGPEGDFSQEGGDSRIVGEMSSAGIEDLISSKFPHLTTDEISNIMSGPPPEDTVSTNYDDRPRFEKSAIEQLGEDPFDIDPYQEVVKSDKRLPELFNFTFRGKINWMDRGRLNKAESDLWDDNVKRFHADTFNKAASRKKTLTAKYEQMINEFDRRKKNRDALEARRQKALDEPKLVKMLNDKGAMTWWKWNRELQVHEDTGRGVKEEDKSTKFPIEITKALGVVFKLMDRVPAEEAVEYTKEELEADPTLLLKSSFGNIFKKYLPPNLLELYQVNLEIINGYYGIGPNKTTGATGAKAKKGVGKAKGATKGPRAPNDQGDIEINLDGQGNII